MTEYGPRGPVRSESELTDTTVEDMFAYTPSENTAITIAETMNHQNIRDEAARLRTQIDRWRSEGENSGKIMAATFALNVLLQALQLAEDMNPGV